ncbi:hypothetical protein EVAR_4404_1 [Eumeta japonica]|uniref:Uncharacterized protein n=1 Tax=Eumeta variegata TaxID=151549 RepID=A0A4C1SXH3_EUMVA|nr:hypothetical protein EVAR_4404_1 [Eumeta japonica]
MSGVSISPSGFYRRRLSAQRLHSCILVASHVVGYKSQEGFQNAGAGVRGRAVHSGHRFPNVTFEADGAEGVACLSDVMSGGRRGVDGVRGRSALTQPVHVTAETRPRCAETNRLRYFIALLTYLAVNPFKEYTNMAAIRKWLTAAHGRSQPQNSN